MLTYCKDYLSSNHSKINITKDISCCLFLLFEKYEETLNFFSKKNFGSFLLSTLNHHLKDKNYQIQSISDIFSNPDEITLNIFSRFLNILIHYSAIFLKNNKADYAKLLLSIGLEVIHKSKFNEEKKIIRKKVSLANNIACTYLLTNNFVKAEIFLEKCKNNSEGFLEKIIAYNNCCLIQIKKIKNLYDNNKKEEIKSVVRDILYYLKLMFDEINKRILNKYKIDLNGIQITDKNPINNINLNDFADSTNKHKEEIFCFIIYNHFKILKNFSIEKFKSNYSKYLSFIQKILGQHHFLALKMIRLDDSEKIKPSSYFNTNHTSDITKDELYIEDSILSTNRNKDNQVKETKREIILEINHQIKKEKKKEIIFEIRHEIKEEIKQEKKKETKLEIINTPIQKIKEEKEEISKNDPNENKEENTNNENNANNEENKKIDEDKKKVPPFSVKKTWKGMFQVITGKKAPQTENKLSNLFKTIEKSNSLNINLNNKINTLGSTIINGNQSDVNAQYNEYDLEMEKYLSEVKTENFFTFNKNYSNNYTDEFIISIIDENNQEKNTFDRIGFEKSQHKEYQKKPVSLFVTSYFKSLLQKKTIYPQLIDDILDYDVLEKMNNLYANKRKNELNLNKEIERISKNKNKGKRISMQNIKVSKINDNTNIENQNILVHFDEDDDLSFDSPQINKSSKIETECYLDADKYKISYINNYEDNKIIINASKTKHSIKKESFDSVSHSSAIKKHIAYNDLYYYFSKYYNRGDFSFCINLRYISSINLFIQRVMVQYVKLIKMNNELQLVFCKYPKGNLRKLYRRGRPEFTFMNERCTFVLCKYKQKTEINIYNLTYTASLTILLSLDESSESLFFAPNKKGSNISGKINADFEYNTNYKIFSRFSNLFIKLQKIFEFRDKTLNTFSEYAKKYKSTIHKISSSDSMINIDLWIISLQEKEIQSESPPESTDNSIINKINIINNTTNKRKVEFQWNVELFTLTKLKIKNGAYYVNKNIILTSRDFVNIIGCDYADIYTIIDEKDNYFCLYFLLGTIQKMKHLLIKMLKSSNYLTAFRLEKLKPISFFKYKFVFRHIKRYFLCSLEYLVYSRQNHFLRIMIMESITNRCYSKIYIPIYSIKKDLDTKEMQKILIEKYETINTLYQDKIKLKKFLSEESKCLLTKNPADDINALILFENIDFLVERIMNFLLKEKAIENEK